MRLSELFTVEHNASPSPWKPHTVTDSDGEGGWACGPYRAIPASAEACAAMSPEEQDDRCRLVCQHDAALIAILRNLAKDLLMVAKAADRLACLVPDHADRPFRERELRMYLENLGNALKDQEYTIELPVQRSETIGC